MRPMGVMFVSVAMAGEKGGKVFGRDTVLGRLRGRVSLLCRWGVFC